VVWVIQLVVLAILLVELEDLLKKYLMLTFNHIIIFAKLPVGGVGKPVGGDGGVGNSVSGGVGPVGGVGSSGHGVVVGSGSGQSGVVGGSGQSGVVVGGSGQSVVGG